MVESASPVRTLARVSVLAALGKESRLAQELRRTRVPLATIKEALLQVYLFAGFPRMINAFIVLEETLGDVCCQVMVEKKAERDLKRRGEQLCRQIYGTAYEPMIARMTHLHPEISRWILTEGYGKVLSRRALDPGTRECLIVPMLAALGSHKQLFFHALGALRLGVRRSHILGALCGTRHLMSRRHYERAFQVIQSVDLKKQR